MSKKYVPSFLKDQHPTSTAPTSNTTQSASFWPGRSGAGAGAPLNTDNKFAALSDDFPMKKPIINTSLPAQMAPKLAPMTLASATSNGAVPIGGAGGASGSKKSFASKFAEQVKIANDPNYKPPPKPVNFESEDDFPSLGGPAKKPAANVVIKPELASAPAGSKFADMAKGWAKKKEDDEENARQKAAAEELLRREADIMRGIPNINRIRRRYAEYDDEDEDEDYNPNYDESSLGDDDSYEVPEGDLEPSDEDENQGEFNSDLGWDGRKRGDLY
jgi:hypothetical protein